MRRDNDQKGGGKLLQPVRRKAACYPPDRIGPALEDIKEPEEYLRIVALKLLDSPPSKGR